MSIAPKLHGRKQPMLLLLLPPPPSCGRLSIHRPKKQLLRPSQTKHTITLALKRAQNLTLAAEGLGRVGEGAA
jgi:hypothetical protein